jgi:hypothetical protein
MSVDGAGEITRNYSFLTDYQNDTAISDIKFDAEFDDIITSLNNKVQAKATAPYVATGWKDGSTWIDTSEAAAGALMICDGFTYWLNKNYINKEYNFFVTGTLAPGTKKAGVLVSTDSLVPLKARAYADTQPGGNLKIDLNKDGSTIFAATDKLKILASSNSGTQTDFTSGIEFDAGDRISVDIDSVDSSVPGGQPLYITLVCRQETKDTKTATDY